MKTNSDVFSIFENLFFKHYVSEYENFPGGYIVIDMNGLVRYVSIEAGLLLGFQPSTALGKHLKEVFPNSLILEALAAGTPLNEIKRSKMVRRLINERDLRCSVIPIKILGKIFSLVENFTDNTYVNLLEKELAEKKDREHLQGLLLNQIVEELYAVNRSGQVIYMTPNAARNMGVDISEVVGLDISDLDSSSRLKEVARTGITKRRTHSRPNKKGISVMEAPLFDDDSVIGAFCSSTYADFNEKETHSKGSGILNKDRLKAPPMVRGSGSRFSIADIIGQSDAIENARKKALRIARGDSTVLITGESGTGKELFAHAIHMASDRKNKPFIRINCASIPETLLEAELFGYEPGSFTGAQKKGKPGKFELAHNGTLFLDEAAEMPLSMQAKLLTVIQEGIFERIGGIASYEVNVRIIAATNKNLWEMVSKGKFREDLYYRLDVVNLRVPPLKERLDDIPLLIEHFLPIINLNVKGHAKKVSKQLLQLFKKYSWPGNVRELRNVLEAAINLSEENIIELHSLPTWTREKMGISSRVKSTKAAKQVPQWKGVDIREKELIVEILKLANGNKRQAAKRLTMARSTFYLKLKSYGLDKTFELKDRKLPEKQQIQDALKLANGNKRQAAVILNMPRSTFYYKLKGYGLT